MHLQCVGGPDTEDNAHVRHPRTGNDRNQKDTNGTASWKRRDLPWFALLEFALLVEKEQILLEKGAMEATSCPKGGNMWRHWYGLTQAWGSTTYAWTLGQILPRCKEESCQQSLTESFVKEKTRVYLCHAPLWETNHPAVRVRDWVVCWPDLSSMTASSVCWRPRHWRQCSCPSSVDRKRPQPEGHGRNGILKKTWKRKTTSQFHWRFLLVRDYWSFQINTLCRHDITRSDDR